MSVTKSTLLCLFLAYTVCAQINFGPPPDDKKVPEKIDTAERSGLLATLLGIYVNFHFEFFSFEKR